jgi:hypothetical protein
MDLKECMFRKRQGQGAKAVNAKIVCRAMPLAHLRDPRGGRRNIARVNLLLSPQAACFGHARGLRRFEAAEQAVRH